MACHNSGLTIQSYSYDGNASEWIIQLRLNVGSGRTGVVSGGSGSTYSFFFGFNAACLPFTVNSFSPSQVTGAYTGCTMPGTNLGPDPYYSTQGNVAYIDPGYFGYVLPCSVTPFACITSLPACGPATSTPYFFTFRTSSLPDSIRVFGIEGNGNPLGGCYPDLDMMVSFVSSNGQSVQVTCPPNQQIAAGPNCMGTLPDYRSLATIHPNCRVPFNPALSQIPPVGTNLGNLGSNLTVQIFAIGSLFSGSTCTFLATVVDLSGPRVTCPFSFSIPASSGCNGILGDYVSMGTITDNCDPNPTIFAQHPSAGTTFIGTSNVRLLGIDSHGNIDSCTFAIATAEIIPPTITCPANQSLPLNAQCELIMPSFASLAVATDNCTAVPTILQSPLQGSIYSGPGIQTITLTAVDGAGNTATCNFTLSRTNANAAQIVCPTNQTLVVGPNCTTLLPDYAATAVVSYGCLPFTYTIAQVPAAGAVLNGTGMQTITLTATDNLGSQQNCTFSVSKVDLTMPTIVCPANDTVELDSNCQYTIVDSRALAVVADNCTSTPTVSQNPAPGTIITGVASGGIYLTATDASGNTSNCYFLESCVDRRPPRITCPPNATISLNANCQATLLNYSNLAITRDNCSGISLRTQSPVAGTVFSTVGLHVITLSATDASSNVGTCTFTVTTVETTPPTITCPPNATLTLNASCQAILPNYLSLATLADNCSPAPTASQSPVAGALLSGAGTTTVTLTATDGTGNTASCAVAVTRVDASAPTVACPPNVNLALNATCQAILPDFRTSANAADNCTTVPTIAQSPLQGSSVSGVGLHAITLTATDASSNAGTCTFTVMTTDNIAPTITCPPNATLTLGNTCQAILPNYAATATITDNCTSALTATQSPIAGTVINGISSQTITLSATDASSNAGTCTFTVMTTDNIAPTLTCPPNATLTLGNTCQAILPNYLSLATLADNCSPAPTASQSPVAGAILSGAGTTTIILTATDGTGNTASCAFAVTRIDLMDPFIICPSSFSFSPSGLDCNPAAFWAAVTATDNCGATLVGSHASGDPFPIGNTVVTYTATDSAGNSSACSFTVTVNSPLITGSTVLNPSNPCMGDVATLTATAANSYTWSTGATGQTLQVTNTGWYWVQVTAAVGCSARDSVFVTFASLPVPTINQVGNQVCTGNYATYQWLLNGTPIPGATNACATIMASGNYTVQVTDSLGCLGTAGPLSLVGIADFATSTRFAVYPVPAQDILHIQLAQPLASPGKFVLYDISGKAVRTLAFERLETTTAFSLQGLSDGSYFLELQADGFWGMKMVVKLR